jgi:uncharacterized damage-inducible protein DinB
MKPDELAEPWLRGPLPGASPFVAPLIRSFEMAREDLDHFTEGLTDAQVWTQTYGVNAVGRELKHIAGSVDRLMTYLEGGPLSAEQLAAMKEEEQPGGSLDALLARVKDSFARAEAIARALDPAKLAEPRAIGRKQLPTTAIGLVVHIAEHTQRHVGQTIRAATLARHTA